MREEMKRYKYNNNMTYYRFLEIQEEVIGIVCNTLSKVRCTNFSDFVLLLARGDYYQLLERKDIDLSPYVIEDPTADYMDRTRLNFLTSYLNEYSTRLRENIYLANVDKEYEMSIQMMIYSHCWESHLLLKLLERIANILKKKGYKWISSVGTTHKSNFIKQNIISQLEGVDDDLANLLKHCYSDRLRNDFAHSTYYIDFKDSVIYSHGQGLFSGQNISFLEWEEKFVYSVMLSYHLISLWQEVKHNFINDYGSDPIQVERPLKANKQKRQIFSLVPKIDVAFSDGRHIKFEYVMSPRLNYEVMKETK